MNVVALFRKSPLRIMMTLGIFLFAFSSSSVWARTYGAWVLDRTVMVAGPDQDYPTVRILYPGTSVTVYGCLAHDAWCDVSQSGDRGWVDADFLQTTYGGNRVIVSEAYPYLAWPIAAFIFDDYWGHHYSHRSWYQARHRWRGHHGHRDYGHHDWSHGRADHGRQDRRFDHRSRIMDRHEERHDRRQDNRQERREERHDRRQDNRQERREERHDRRQDNRQERREERHDRRQSRHQGGRPDRKEGGHQRNPNPQVRSSAHSSHKSATSGSSRSDRKDHRNH